jgi:CTP synthase
LVPGGFGHRGIEGKIIAAKYAREHKVPYLGLCLGMQMMVVEFAREVLNDPKANSTEFDPQTSSPVIDLMLEQRHITDMGGTMRLGLYPCKIAQRHSRLPGIPGGLRRERHRHRYELNNDYRDALQKAGMVFSGQSPDGLLVEIAEFKDHPFMLGSQFHRNSFPDQPSASAVQRIHQNSHCREREKSSGVKATQRFRNCPAMVCINRSVN